MKKLLVFFPSIALALFVVSSEFGDLSSVIYDLLGSAESASVVALSVDDPLVIEKLSEIPHWVVTEYPSPIDGRVDSSPGLLHAKVAFFGKKAIFGSMNFTTSSLHEDLNDAIVFEENCALDFFSTLIDSLWKGERLPSEWICPFGTFYVSPSKDLEEIVMRILEKAKRRVRIAVYAFTDMNVLGALKYLSYKGVDVKIALDDWNEDWMLKENLDQFDVKVFRNTTLHHKFIIVDGKYLITGSANITESAFRKNVEVVFVTEDKGIITKYEEIFEALWRW